MPRDFERVAAALHLRRRESGESIEKELREERASTLSRAATRLRDALDRLAAAEAAAATAEREALLQQAADAAFAMIVQREALGLLDGEALLDFHGVPRAVRARLGRWSPPVVRR